MPAKLAARVRLFDTGHNRKTDALDAHSIAMVALRTAGLRELTADGELEALRMLADRRDELAHRRVQTVNRLQRLLSELVPGQRKRDLSALQAKAILASVRPRDLAGKTRRRMAAEELADLVAVDAKLKKIKAELTRRGPRPRLDPHGHHRRRPGRSRPDPGRRRRRRPVRRPEPVRVLDRDRAAGRLLRRADPPPAVPGREPADEPRPAHRGDRPAASRHPRPGLLPDASSPPARPGWRRCAASNDACPTSCTDSSRRRPTPRASRRGGPGRALRGDSSHPARSTCTRTSTLRISHFPDPRHRRYARPSRRPKGPATAAARTRPLTQRGARSGRDRPVGAFGCSILSR